MYAALMEVIEHGHKVAQSAGQTVKFPDNERVAVLQRLEATEQGRALGGASRALVLKDFLAPRAFQGGELHGRVLFLGRDAGVTVFHSRDYETSNLKHPSPLFTGSCAVFHNLPFVKHALSRICLVTWARGGTPGNLPRGASVRR
jgi:hypothetical protein